MSECNPVGVAPGVSKISAKLLTVMSQLGWMEKRGKNEMQKYAYVMADDMASAVRDVLIKEGVSVTASVLDVKNGEIQGANKAIRTCLVLVAWRFTDVESGETITCIIPGEAMDSGDKAIYKAMTGSMKYALKLNFLIPTGEDPEEDSEADKEVYGKAAAKPAPAKRTPAPAKPKGAAQPAGDMAVPFGKHKGKSISDPSIPDGDLEWLKGNFEKAVERHDEKWHDKNVQQLEALNAEIARRMESPPEPGNGGDEEIPF